ncbi:Tetratricopeptide repeat protein [Thalassoglobus neptunius]|uniref:Tetratricopeptide repeat protein n=1 Tax=Thalassoglobus neptunius TaxID=1938619 RepID=A0A5C5WPW7_9PLAN|nr:tetratricopeptide repeat protein [Thalassoglobus neptunius]TWT51852.1 Tetratricopeptide repeat protein [Thalassoglobus neptunius]
MLSSTESQQPDTNNPEKESPSSGSTQSKSVSRQTILRRAILFAILVIVVLGLKNPVVNAVQSYRAARFKSECKALIDAEDWSGARSTARAWLKMTPGSNDALVFLAEAAVQLDDPEEAADSLSKVSDDYHGALQALAVCAELQFTDLNQPYQAEATWKRMLEIDPLADVAHQRLIYFYAMTLQRQAMRDQIEQAMELGCEPPEAYPYLLLANVLNFSDGLKKVSRWRQSNRDDEILEVAQSIYAAKRTEDSGMATFGIQTITPGDKTLLDRCIQKYPGNLEALSLQIEFAMFGGDPKTVAKLLAQAGAEAESDSRFWRYRGWLFQERGRDEESAKSLERALEINPFEWQSRWLLADIYRKLGKSELASKHAKIAAQGKDLQTQLFERPNARDLTPELMQQIYDYLHSIGPSIPRDAIEKRI